MEVERHLDGISTICSSMGSVLAGHVWHRAANLIIIFPRRVLRVPVGRYVDDIFGASVLNLTSGFCEDVLASKFAGRLTFSVSLAANKVGRSYVRGFYAQANGPLENFVASPWLHMSTAFFKAYFMPFTATRTTCNRRRRRVNCWSDATGAGRTIVAFCHIPEVGWRYTVWRPPESVFFRIAGKRR